MTTNAALWAADLEVGLRHEENRTRAEADVDQVDDTAVVLGLRAAHRMRLDPLTSFVIGGDLDARWWTRFEDTSVFSAALEVRLRRKLNAEFGAPWAEIAAGIRGLKHRDSDIRDGATAFSTIVFGKRLSSSVSARSGYRYQIRRAVEGTVFDLEHNEVFAQLDFNIGPKWLLYAEVNVLEGEITSVATLPNPKVRAAANAITGDSDPAFETGPSPFGLGERPRWTYQLDAVVTSAELGINYPLARGLALDMAARYITADAAGDNQYNGYVVNAGVFWRF